MDELTLAYLAGCIDCDGYITIRHDEWEMRAGRRVTPTFHEQIGLRHVTPQVPALLHSLFGGSLYMSKSSAANGRPLHSWHVESRKAAAAVTALLPYLRVKASQAAVLLELRAHKDGRTTRGRGVSISPEDVAIRDALRQRVRTLNAVGVAKPV